VSAPPDPFRGQLGEPALDEVEAGGVGRREVEREAGMTLQPALDGGRLVRRGVVEHEVDVEVHGHVGVEHVQEAAELLGAMAEASSP
jgi:hypothetical protein